MTRSLRSLRTTIRMRRGLGRQSGRGGRHPSPRSAQRHSTRRLAVSFGDGMLAMHWDPQQKPPSPLLHCHLCLVQRSVA